MRPARVQSDDAVLHSLLDPWSMVDVVLIVVLAAFIFRKSRVASTLMFVYFVASKLLQLAEGAGASAGMIVAVCSLLCISSLPCAQRCSPRDLKKLRG